MKMWLCSVLNDENLDPLVELVISPICIHNISLVGTIYFHASLLPSLPFLAASHAGHKLKKSRDLAKGLHILFRKKIHAFPVARYARVSVRYQQRQRQQRMQQQGKGGLGKAG